MEKKWEALCTRLSGGPYPSGYTKAQRQTFRRFSLKFTLKDGVLFRKTHVGLCKVLRSEKEIEQVLRHYHDDNNHPGQSKLRGFINRKYYWCSMCPAIKKWIQNCEICRNRPVKSTGETSFHCIAYGCESNSIDLNDGTTYHRFPRDDPGRMDLWVALAQRDRWSIGSKDYLCSKHFTDDCFESLEEGHILKPDAVPTVAMASPPKEEKLFLASEAETVEPCLEFENLEELISASDDTLKYEEHQYALPPSETNRLPFRKGRADGSCTGIKEPLFARYDAMESYLSTGRFIQMPKAVKGSIRRQSKRFILKGGVLMNNQRPTLRRVLRSREEVVTILKKFHDDLGHRGMSYSYAPMSKHYFWGTMNRDLADWIANCEQCCVDRESRKHMCSVYKCKNYSGPVERGLGITFHQFPIHKPHLLDCWIKAMGRTSWFPRPRSVVCSGHFTVECFARSGETVFLKPDAVPTLFLYQQPVQQYPSISKKCLAMGLNEGTTSDQAFFAKYDVVDRYLRENIYPPGLNCVEKNTIRQFCKKFIIKDGLLHITIKNQVLKVLRSQEEVNEVLVEFHDELNHLNLMKCMRLLTEQYFWGTMEVDVSRWIENCSECRGALMELEHRQEPATRVPQPTESWKNNTDMAPISAVTGRIGEGDIADWVDDCPESSASTKKTLLKPKQSPEHASRVLVPVKPEDIIIDVIPFSPESSASVKAGEEDGSHDVHDDAERGVEQQPVPTNAVMQTALFSQKHNKVVLVRALDLEPMQPQPLKTQTRYQTRTQTRTQAQGRCSEQEAISNSTPCSESTHSQNLKACTPSPPQSSAPPQASPPISTMRHKTLKRSRMSPDQCVLSKRKAPPLQNTTACNNADRLQARIVLQQCSQALLKIRPVIDGAEAKWVQIQEGIVVYLCFFKGATEEIIPKIVETLLETKLFKKSNGRMVSVLKLPGSILLIPQDTLTGNSICMNRVMYPDKDQQRRGAQLYGQLVTECEKAMNNKLSTDSGVEVKHGTYGNKQEILVNSQEPSTLLLEF